MVKKVYQVHYTDSTGKPACLRVEAFNGNHAAWEAGRKTGLHCRFSNVEVVRELTPNGEA